MGNGRAWWKMENVQSVSQVEFSPFINWSAESSLLLWLSIMKQILNRFVNILIKIFLSIPLCNLQSQFLLSKNTKSVIK